MNYTPQEVMQYIQEEDVKFIRLAFCDCLGHPKNISIMPQELERAFKYGISIDGSAIVGFGDESQSDLFLHPDPATIMVLPYIYQGIRNSLNAINAQTLIQAAQMLGCGRFRAYVQVVLPNMFSGILVSALLAESVVFGDFVLANNIAGNNYQNIQVFLNRRMFTSSGLASAIVVVIFLVVFIVTGLVLKLQKNESKEK